MSKRTKRCPACGAQIPLSATACNKCGSKVEGDGWVDTLPKPVRPVETSRWPEKPSYEEAAAQRKTDNQSRTQLIAVLAVIVVIIVLAIVLVVKMNAPQEPPVSESQSMSENSLYVLDPNGGLEEPVDLEEEEEEAPAPTDTPETDPEPTPEATEAPESEDEEPESEDETPEEAQPEEEEFTVSEMEDTVYITGSSVNLRTGPGTDYDVSATKTKGTELKRTGAVENGWSRVEYDGKVCYIYNDYISTEKPPVEVESQSDTVVITEDANLRSGPGTDHDVVTTLSAKTELKRTGVAENGWSRVEYDGKEVYIHSNLIQVKEEESESDEETESAQEPEGEDENTESFHVTEEAGTLKVTVDIGANIRSGPGSDYDLLGAVAKDTELTMTGKTDDNWYRVEYNDKTGYVAGSLVTKN